MTRSRLRMDRDGNSYLGVAIRHRRMRPFLLELYRLLGAKAYRAYRKNKIRRDGLGFHLTVVTPREMDRLKHAPKLRGRAPIRLKGLGRVRQGKNTAYFVVASCPAGSACRGRLSLPEKDFHVTLGFSPQDIYGLRKNDATLLSMPS